MTLELIHIHEFTIVAIVRKKLGAISIIFDQNIATLSGVVILAVSSFRYF